MVTVGHCERQCDKAEPREGGRAEGVKARGWRVDLWSIQRVWKTQCWRGWAQEEAESTHKRCSEQECGCPNEVGGQREER
jgi:hypothetical protein